MNGRQILIIADKFRGTLSSLQASEAIAAGLRQVWGDRFDYRVRSMADGGEDTAAALPGLCVVESARHIGHGNAALTRLGIMERSSAPLGRAILQALQSQQPVAVAIGGTVTADGGAGMLAALGARFYDSCGREVSRLCPATLPLIARTDLTATLALTQDLMPVPMVLSDVRATLTGPGLSALDFLSQKGATADDVGRISLALKHLQQVLGGSSPYDGAGGGVGYALCSVLGWLGCTGAGFILSQLDVDPGRLAMVVTGEGSIDHQSLGGKVVGTILDHFARLGTPVVAFGGRVAPELAADPRLIAVTPPGPLPSPTRAARLLSQAAADFARANILHI